MRTQVQSLASLSGLRNPCCRGCGVGQQVQLRSDPSPGYFPMLHVQPVKAKKKVVRSYHSFAQNSKGSLLFPIILKVNSKLHTVPARPKHDLVSGCLSASFSVLPPTSHSASAAEASWLAFRQRDLHLRTFAPAVSFVSMFSPRPAHSSHTS